MSTLRRGFKTWCENAAWGFRRDLNLPRHAALPLRDLAQRLGVGVLVPSDIPGLEPQYLHQLLKAEPWSWSAVTLTVASRTVMIINSSHSPERENSNMAHELAHVVLEHRPTTVFVTSDGQMMMRHYDKVQEEEAKCLAGALLVPRQGLLDLLEQGMSDAALARHFEVSADLLRMRKNLTAVERQLGRRAQAS